MWQRKEEYQSHTNSFIKERQRKCILTQFSKGNITLTLKLQKHTEKYLVSPWMYLKRTISTNSSKWAQPYRKRQMHHEQSLPKEPGLVRYSSQSMQLSAGSAEKGQRSASHWRQEAHFTISGLILGKILGTVGTEGSVFKLRKDNKDEATVSSTPCWALTPRAPKTQRKMRTFAFATYWYFTSDSSQYTREILVNILGKRNKE